MSETPIMNPLFSDHHLPPEWLIALSKGASFLRFTANTWTWMTEPAVRESLRIADTLTEIQNAFHVDSEPSSRSMLMDGTDGAYYADPRQHIMLRCTYSYPLEYSRIEGYDCIRVASLFLHGHNITSSWSATIRDLMLAGF